MCGKVHIFPKTRRIWYIDAPLFSEVLVAALIHLSVGGNWVVSMSRRLYRQLTG